MLHYDIVPATETENKSLMIVLHGLGDSLEGYRFLPQVLNLPWMDYALVNAPDDYYGGYSWYDIDGDSHTGVVRSRKLLTELLDHFRTQGHPAERTYLFGFSQGCLMTWEIGLRYPHRLAGCVGISGYAHQSKTLMEEASEVAKEQSFLITHGHHDPVIPFDAVKADVERLKNWGAQAEWHEFPKEHTIAGQEEIDLIRQFVVRQRQNQPGQ